MTNTSEESRPLFSKQQEIVVERIHSYTVSTYKHKPYDYYKILDLDHSERQNITPAILKKTYRKLAINLHPDKNSHPKAPDCFKLINKVYEFLSDENNKKNYDIDGIDYTNKKNSGHDGNSSAFSSRRGAGSPFFNQHAGHNPFFQQQQMNPEDLFNMFAGFPQGGSGGGFSFGNGGGSFQTFHFDPFTGGFQAGGPRRARPRGPRSAQDQRTEEGAQEDRMVLLRALAPVLIVLLISILQRIFKF
ncbi:hypothetical protein ACO0SA_001292 [Hanseniaspora valbyensis]